MSRTQWDMTGKTRCIGGEDDLAPERKKGLGSKLLIKKKSEKMDSDLTK